MTRVFYGIAATSIVIAIVAVVVTMYKQSHTAVPAISSSKEYYQSPEERIRTLIPTTWMVQSKENTIPMMWSGDSICEEVSATNPTEKYHDPHGFDYTATHTFWFCPKQWVGQKPKIGAAEQVYPARLLANTQRYRIFALSLGSSSQSDLEERVKTLFSKP